MAQPDTLRFVNDRSTRDPAEVAAFLRRAATLGAYAERFKPTPPLPLPEDEEPGYVVDVTGTLVVVESEDDAP